MEDLNTILYDYNRAKFEYDEAKNKLNQQKSKVLSVIGDKLKKSGTTTFNTENFQLKYQTGTEYIVDNSNVEYLNQALAHIYSHYELDQPLLNWKATLNKKVYDSLCSDGKEIINKFLTSKSKSPVFTVKEVLIENNVS